MNGKFLLDTNFIIYALNSKAKLPPFSYCYSPITKIELLAYPKLTTDENNAIQSALARMQLVECDTSVIDKTITIRRNTGLKLPDSLICASSIVASATLITDDDRLHRVQGVDALTYRDFMSLIGKVQA